MYVLHMVVQFKNEMTQSWNSIQFFYFDTDSMEEDDGGEGGHIDLLYAEYDLYKYQCDSNSEMCSH